MFRNYNLISNSILIGVLLNILLPFLVSPFASPNQIKPPFGADKLNFFDQIMHMLIHHNQVPITSSVIIALIIGLSMYLAYNISDNNLITAPTTSSKCPHCNKNRSCPHCIHNGGCPYTKTVKFS